MPGILSSSQFPNKIAGKEGQTMIRRILAVLILVVGFAVVSYEPTEAAKPSPTQYDPPGEAPSVTQPAAENHSAKKEEVCKDLKGGFAKIGVLPVKEGGASAIDFHKIGLVLEPVPEEGIPFVRMTAGKGRCYTNGIIPPQDEGWDQVFVGVRPITGEVVAIANCGNEIESDFRFPPVEGDIGAIYRSSVGSGGGNHDRREVHRRGY